MFAGEPATWQCLRRASLSAIANRERRRRRSRKASLALGHRREDVMTIENLHRWQFTPPPFDGCEIRCPACQQWSSHHEWGSVTPQSDHTAALGALACPRCEASFEPGRAPTFAVRAPQ